MKMKLVSLLVEHRIGFPAVTESAELLYTLIYFYECCHKCLTIGQIWKVFFSQVELTYLQFNSDVWASSAPRFHHLKTVTKIKLALLLTLPHSSGRGDDCFKLSII